MWQGLLVATLLAGCLGDQTSKPGETIVSLTFDDTNGDQVQAATLAEARGMRATFYVNSGRIDMPTYLTLSQLLAMQSSGHEIAGHTVDHPHLSELTADEQKHEICADRASLLQAGFRVTSFAYPFSDQDSVTRDIVAGCGYNSARLVGRLFATTSCTRCPYANPIPPKDPYAVRTNESVQQTTTLDDMKLYVTQAEQHGGGWIPLVFHHVCDGCDQLSITPTQLADFLDWLQARAAAGTVTATVDEVIGGTLEPSP